MIDETNASGPESTAMENLATTDTTGGESEGSTGLFGKLSAQEAGRLSGEARRAKRKASEQAALDARQTFRGRLGVALAKLSQTDLDHAISGLARSGRPADLRALAGLADQAYGRPGQATPEDESEGVPALSPEARAAFLAEYAARQSGAAGDMTDPRDTEEHAFQIGVDEVDVYPYAGNKGDVHTFGQDPPFGG